jgi:hypothetical protein
MIAIAAKQLLPGFSTFWTGIIDDRQKELQA